MDKRNYLLEQLKKKIDDFQEHSLRHKKMYRRIKYMVFVLTALSTLLAGISLKFPELSSNINIVIVLVSAAIGVITSIEGLRKPSELWIHERTTYFALTDLKREVEFMLEERYDKKELEKYFFRMQEILGASGKKWSQHITGNQQRQDTQEERNQLRDADSPCFPK